MPRVGPRGPRGYKRSASLRKSIEDARLEGRTVTAKDVAPGRKGAKMVRRGGSRPGAGGPPLRQIKELVERTGAPLDEVLALPNIPPIYFDDPDKMGRLRDIVERAQLVFRLNVRAALAKKGVGALSVSALLGLARNTAGLEFDQQSAQVSSAPDVAGIEKKIDELLERLARKAKTEAVPDPTGPGPVS